MAVAGRSTYRVIRSGFDMAVVTEVKEDDTSGGGSPKETRNPKLCIGGADSFWHVTGVKKEVKFVTKADDSAGRFSGTNSALSSRIRGSLIFLPSELHGHAGKGKMDTVSFATATRLWVGYSPDHMSFSEMVDLLRAGRLSLPTTGTVDALQVRDNLWMLDGFHRQSDGLYGLAPQTTIRSVRVVRHEGKTDAMRLSSGLVVFQSKPRWSEPADFDLRTDEEIIKSAEGWLSRATGAIGDEATTARDTLGDLLRSHVASTVGGNERDDLQSALRLISDRPSLLEVIPQMLSKDPAWADRMEEFRISEENRLRDEIRLALTVESEIQDARLAELRTKVRDAEDRLEVIAHREILLRNESERHESDLKDRLAEAARQLGKETADAAKALRDELSALRDEMSRLEQRAPDTPLAPVQPSVEPEPVSDAIREADLGTTDDAEMHATVTRLAEATGLSSSELVAFLLLSMEDVPVIIGSGAARAAAEIAFAIAGDEAAIVFCDPTHVSLQDIINDEAGGYMRAVATARSNPHILIPVAFCCITSSPCEYWLPRLVEMRRLGRYPRNLSFFATAGDDGLRISVPDSVLRYMAPLKLPDKLQQSAGVPFAGHWTTFVDGDGGRLAEVIDVLTSTDDPDPAFIKRRAKMLSKTPSAESIRLLEVAAALHQQDVWLKTLDSASDHELTRFFKNIEG